MNDINPNLIAYLALLIWPAVGLYLYSKLPVNQATLWTILGGYLLLPDGLDIKFQMIPGFNKVTIPNLVAFIGCVLYARPRPTFLRRFGLEELLVLLLLIGPFVTSLLNTDPIRIGDTLLPGVGAYDAGSTVIYEFIYILPFFIARQVLRTDDDNVQILRVMVIAGLAYSLPMLFEIRMSPQLSQWIYGYTYRSIISSVRADGFRPVVFLTNGLLVAFFTMTTAVAAAALWRTQTRIGRWPLGRITGYLSFMLVMCKTLGALVYGAVLVPLVRWTSPRLQLRVACVLVAVALFYPMLRAANAFPTNTFVQVARLVSDDRANSLNTRFVNEDLLLDRATERPWFGWGRYGRSRVYNGWLGTDSSLTDGYWIIILGQFGIVGFVATFGLLSLAVFRAAMASRFAQVRQQALHVAALALIVAINVVDLLPNAPMSPWTWLLVGALVGRAEALRAAKGQIIRPLQASLLVDRPAS